MSWRVFIDFDGTIAVDDSTDLILARFAEPEWEAVESEWRAGRIGSRECMARQIDLLRVTDVALDRFIDSVCVDPAVPAFIDDCRRRAMPVTVVSDGLDRVVKAVLARAGLGDVPVVANALVYRGDGRWKLEFPYARGDCRSLAGTCKCAIARQADAGVSRCLSLLIGDGRSDQCAAEDVDFVFAKKGLIAHCRDKGVAHRAFSTFADARRLLAMLVDPTRHEVRVAHEGETAGV